MHICLVIDLLTAAFLIHGLLHSSTRLRKQLCAACLIYLAFISLHTYFSLAEYFGYFERYPSFTTRGFDALLRFFGGFWRLFGVLVLAKGVTWIALAFGIHAIVEWYRKSKAGLSAPALNFTPPQSPPAAD